MKKNFIRYMLAVALSSTVLPLGAQAQSQLLVTELNSNASEGDFWELSNLGTSVVDLYSGTTPWSWSDGDTHTAGQVELPVGISIAPGESIVFLANGDADVATFRSDWGISSSVQIYGDVNSPGFGKNDGVYLYDSAGAIVTSFLYSAGDFTLSNGDPSLGGHAGVSAGGTATDSAIWDPTSGISSPRYTFADGSNFGTYAASVGDGIGSPGFSGLAPVPEPAACALFGLGAGALLAFRRRK